MVNQENTHLSFLYSFRLPGPRTTRLDSTRLTTLMLFPCSPWSWSCAPRMPHIALLSFHCWWLLLPGTCNWNATIAAGRYGPHFEDIKTIGNVTNMTVQMGQSVYLNCRISLLQDKTVSLQLYFYYHSLPLAPWTRCRIPNENTMPRVLSASKGGGCEKSLLNILIIFNARSSSRAT